MNSTELQGIMQFLQKTEKLKDTLRSSHTSTGRTESVAEHTWRLCLMAMLLCEHFPDVDFGRLIRMCIIHDLGEAISGDIPAVVQAAKDLSKSANERRDFCELVSPLSQRLQAELIELWDEYECAKTPEARLAKALDKFETIMQHNQGLNPPNFDYDFNIGYGRNYTTGHPLFDLIRAELDRETRLRAKSVLSSE